MFSNWSLRLPNSHIALVLFDLRLTKPSALSSFFTTVLLTLAPLTFMASAISLGFS